MFPEPYLSVGRTADAADEARWFTAFAVGLKCCPRQLAEQQSQNGLDFAGRSTEEAVSFLRGFSSPDSETALALRYVARPAEAGLSATEVKICILGRAIGATKDDARRAGANLHREALAQLGGAFPDHVWESATRQSFKDLWAPFRWSEGQIAEIRRREEFINLEAINHRPALGAGQGGSSAARFPAEEAVYIVHSFLPRPNSQERLLRRLVLHREIVVLTVGVKPASMGTEELRALEGEITKCEAFLQRAAAQSSIAPAKTIQTRRAAALCEALLAQLSRLKDGPFKVWITVASPCPLPRILLDAIGNEISAPVVGEAGGRGGSLWGGGYDVEYPSSERERMRLCRNTAFLEFASSTASTSPADLRSTRSVMDATEATAAFRLPFATGAGMIGIEVRASRTQPLPRELAAVAGDAGPGSVILVGENRYLGSTQKVCLPRDDCRQHTYVVGQTGTGKTTALETMILADIEAGSGLAVVDPHGDLFQDLLQRIPRSRLKDVVVLDPTDEEFAVGLNPLECASEDERHFVVREMTGIMERLLQDRYGTGVKEWTGPIFYQHMQMNMLLVMSRLGRPGTLLDFYEIYQSDDAWKRWLPLEWSDPQLVSWVEDALPMVGYTQRSSKAEASYGEYLSSKFVDFVFDPKLRRIFGQRRSTIDLARIMDERKILLVNLAKGDLAEANSRFLGMVLMAKIQAAALRRARRQALERPIFRLYVDEFQSLATGSFTTMLSEARKFGLSLVLANQFVAQIEDQQIVRSLFGNVGTLISFRVGPADAALLEGQFQPFFGAGDLVNLPNWEACVRTTVRGGVVSPFSLTTSRPAAGEGVAAANEVREASRKSYGRPRDEVDRHLEETFRRARREASDDGG